MLLHCEEEGECHKYHPQDCNLYDVLIEKAWLLKQDHLPQFFNEPVKHTIITYKNFVAFTALSNPTQITTCLLMPPSAKELFLYIYPFLATHK